MKKKKKENEKRMNKSALTGLSATGSERNGTNVELPTSRRSDDNRVLPHRRTVAIWHPPRVRRHANRRTLSINAG